MKISDAVEQAKYVVDGQGNRTDIVIPLETWKELLLALQRLVEMIENQEDRAIATEWLEQRAAGVAKTISLADLERELVEDGLLPG
jgi:hypothetical protein